MSEYFELIQDLESHEEKYEVQVNIAEDSVVSKGYCSCCLSQSSAFLSVSNCSHYDYYKKFFDIKNLHEVEYICVYCHEMLKKIESFNNMVLGTYYILANTINLQNSRRKKHVDLQIAIGPVDSFIEYNDEMNNKPNINENIKEEPVISCDDDYSAVNSNSVDNDNSDSTKEECSTEKDHDDEKEKCSSCDEYVNPTIHAHERTHVSSVSRRPRKTERKSVDACIIEEARRLIADGRSQRQAAAELGIPESTLRTRLKHKPVPRYVGNYCTFSAEMELKLFEYIHKLDTMFYGLTDKELRVLAYDFSERHNIKHRFNRDKKIAGKEWLRYFIKKHPSLSLRQQQLEQERAIGLSKSHVDRFYADLSHLYDKHKYPPHKIFSMDEGFFSTDLKKPSEVISTVTESGDNVVVCAMNARGQFISPMMFKQKEMDANAPSSIEKADSSFMTTELFLRWLQHFKAHAMPTNDQRVLLILDHHPSHCSLATVDYCSENYIDLLSVPPYSSPMIQPIDRCFFNHLNEYFTTACESWLLNHPGQTMTTSELATIFTPAYAKAASVANAIEGFRVTGIWPLNNQTLTDDDITAISGKPPDASGNPNVALNIKDVLTPRVSAESERVEEFITKEDITEKEVCQQTRKLPSISQDPTPSTSTYETLRSLLFAESEIVSSLPHEKQFEVTTAKKTRKS